jgi:hypothetical protein
MSAMNILMISNTWVYIIVGIVVLHFAVGIGYLIYKIYGGKKK